MAEKKDYLEPELYTNRELSWILFNKRVLSEARDKQIPLFERLKFLSITASNLDEFFMVRVASLKDMVNAKYIKKDIAGLTAAQQLEQLNVVTHDLVSQQYSTYNRSLLPLLKANGLTVVEQHENLNEEQAAYVDAYFDDNVYPFLQALPSDSQQVPEYRGAAFQTQGKGRTGVRYGAGPQRPVSYCADSGGKSR